MIRQPSPGAPAQTQRHPRFAAGLVRLCTLLLSASCGAAVSAVGDGPGPAEVQVSRFSEALAARYTAPERSGRYAAARRKLVKGALIPSRVYGDTSIWSSVIPPASEVLTARGALTDHGYRFEIAPDGAGPLKLGDARHKIMLRRLSDSEFRWDAAVDVAIGSLTAGDAAAMLVELLASGHEHDPAAIRTDAVSAFPRSSAVMSRVFTIDSLTMHPGGYPLLCWVI